MPPLISIEDVSRAFGKTRILRRVRFGAGAGEAVGIIGPNGAGKTTLLRIVVGLLHADAGLIRIDGEPVPAALAHVRVGYFAGECTLPPAVGGRTWRSLFRDVDSAAENRPVRLLSRGTRQMLGLRTVLSLPALRAIVLDEPWEGLDPDASRWLTESLRARRDGGTAIIVSSHRLHDLADVCDRYVFLDGGTATAIHADTLKAGGLITGDTLLEAFDAVRRNR